MFSGGGVIEMAECGKPCEVYSRVVGYFRPVQNWNAGKQSEFGDRKEFSLEKSLKSENGNKVKVEEMEAQQTPSPAATEKKAEAVATC